MPITLTCHACGAEYREKPGRAERSRYCSKQCFYADKRTVPDATCRQCGKVYRPYGATMGDKFCSADCYTAYRRAMPPEERAALMAKATAVIRGAKRSQDDLCKRARTKQERATLSGDEAEIMAALNAADLYPVPLYAFDKYNIDFAFPEIMVAVEYHGGNWHNTAKKRAEDEAKAAFLRAQGWTLVTLPRLDKPQANDAGNRRITIESLVSHLSKVVHSA